MIWDLFGRMLKAFRITPDEFRMILNQFRIILIEFRITPDQFWMMLKAFRMMLKACGAYGGPSAIELVTVNP